MKNKKLRVKVSLIMECLLMDLNFRHKSRVFFSLSLYYLLSFPTYRIEPDNSSSTSTLNAK